MLEGARVGQREEGLVLFKAKSRTASRGRCWLIWVLMDEQEFAEKAKRSWHIPGRGKSLWTGTEAWRRRPREHTVRGWTQRHCFHSSSGSTEARAAADPGPHLTCHLGRGNEERSEGQTEPRPEQPTSRGLQPSLPVRTGAAVPSSVRRTVAALLTGDRDPAALSGPSPPQPAEGVCTPSPGGTQTTEPEVIPLPHQGPYLTLASPGCQLGLTPAGRVTPNKVHPHCQGQLSELQGSAHTTPTTDTPTPTMGHSPSPPPNADTKPRVGEGLTQDGRVRIRIHTQVRVSRGPSLLTAHTCACVCVFNPSKGLCLLPTSSHTPRAQVTWNHWQLLMGLLISHLCLLLAVPSA